MRGENQTGEGGGTQTGEGGGTQTGEGGIRGKLLLKMFV